ncbi:conserved hypothetical protein [Trichophyton verrucosum HKI 0517]|uniref:Uncharacterized protein n=1 Tax=Trichophyton verrucosum (strain HKI 0517) TaxID=663202 RepID=D4D757_TRIVH|nr:uncharacterized protein TRV_02936 [Trichophyton verrucosum HKI 0517]EFE42331.1 conserved hypothetical protein [Trichophyton verrucosum HKI 0517]
MPGDVSPAFMGGRVRSTSLSFERSASISSRASAPSPPLVNPAPQYVAISAATQLISASHGVNPLQPKEGRPGNAIVTPPSLVLVNGFLDHILFNILLAAKSTKLAAIRPAVSDVLKPRLARAVVSVADEELSEYMGTSDEEELTGYGYSQEAAGQGHFELERSWKLTRLRCMVYARLGDMEEDDEEEYLQREGLSETNGRPYFMNHGGMLSPAAAIFLTSILEYIAENILIIAGENSSARLGFSDENDERKYQGGTLVVDDVDVEKVALNPTLGRLWRTWRKNLRAPALSRTLSRESLVRRGCSSRTSTHSSVGTFDTFDTFNGFSFGRKISSADQHVSDTASVSTCVNINPADIPLPISEYGIDEIEIPGFSAQLAVALPARSLRPRSLFISSPEVAGRPVLARSISAISPRVVMASASASSSLQPARSSTRRAHIRSQSLPQSMYITSPLAPSPTRVKRSASSAAETRKEDEHLESMPEAEEPETDTKAGESASASAAAAAAAAAATVAATAAATAAPASAASELEQAGPDSASIYSPYHPASISSPRCQDSSMEQETVSPPSSETGDNNSVVSSIYTIPEASRVSSKESAESTTSQTADSSSARITTCEDIADGNPAYYSSSSLTDDDQAARKAARRKATAPLPPTSNPFGDNIVETSFVSRSPRSPSRGARLTPLTEVADNTPVQNERSSPDQASINSGDSEPSVTPRSRAWLTKINTNCSTRQNLPVSPGSERAAVQRVTPPPSSISRDSSKLRRSESAGSRRDGRPITSGSGVSQGSNRIRGLISRQPSDLSVSVICSSDGSGSGSTALEELLMSDETIHYTLTPRNMREMEEVGSPRWAATRPADLAADPADTSSVKSGKQSRRILSPTFRSPSISSPVPQSPLARNPPSPPPPKPKMPAPQARDARVENASVRDFANFIRSTGPDKGLHPPAAQFNSIARAGNNSIPNSPATTGTYSTSPLATPKASTKDNNNNNTSSNITSTPRATNPNRPRLEARPAVFVRDNKTSELIDFIRQGPPDPQARRLQQKTVAPFRNTMNSDDFSSFSQTIRSERDFTIGDSSIPGTQDGSMVAASVASVNSHTALIDSSTRPNSRTLQYRLSPTPNIRGDGSATPAKTRRRVRDPYAIDSDSEDEYDDVRDVAKPKEESLAEFLKNGPPPPPPPKPQPFTINIQKANELHRQKAMRPPISRSVTLDSTSEAGSPAPPRLVDLPPKYNYHSHAGRPQASLTSGSSFVATIHADQPDNQWHSGGRLPKGVIKGVDADSLYRSNKSDTAALADFLKNTGPPSSPSVSSLQSMKTGTSASWTFKTFLRKKKQVA